MVYIIAILISVCLICGQTAWASAVKSITQNNVGISTVDLLLGLLSSYKLWVGGLFYIAGTVLYFILLSKIKFFSIQTTMTGLAIVFSVLISYFIFKEHITPLNILGVVLVIIGIFLVMLKASSV